MVDRLRRLDDRETTSRIMLLARLPGDARDRAAGPRLGPGLPGDRGAVLFVAGTPWTHFAALGALAAAASCSCWWPLPRSGVQVLKPYQVDRLTAFLNPSTNPRKQGYQINSR